MSSEARTDQARGAALRTLAAVLFLTLAAFAALSLAFGAPYLDATLPGGLPLGNALTAIGLCAVASASVALSSTGTKLRRAALGSLFAAAVWLPASIVLAGNLSLNFRGGNGLAWLAFSLVLVVGLLGTLIWALVAALLFGPKRNSASATQFHKRSG